MIFDVLMSKSMVGIVLAFMAGIAGIASYNYFKMPEDNPVEECAEYVIKAETGLDIDLSPTSKEN